jgi:hypothetical protein
MATNEPGPDRHAADDDLLVAGDASRKTPKPFRIWSRRTERVERRLAAGASRRDPPSKMGVA